MRNRVQQRRLEAVCFLEALQPDLVLANVEENTRDDVEALIAAGLPVFVTYPRTVAVAIAELHQLAEMTGSTEAASPIIELAERSVELKGLHTAPHDQNPVRASSTVE